MTTPYRIKVTRLHLSPLHPLLSFRSFSSRKVFDDGVTSYASDIYSFGVVVWEILSRALPWAAETRGQDIYRRVVIKGERPVIPVDAPADLAGVVRDCWAANPGKRPSSEEIMEVIAIAQMEGDQLLRSGQPIQSPTTDESRRLGSPMQAKATHNLQNATIGSSASGFGHRKFHTA